MLNTTVLPPQVRAQVTARLASPGLGRWLAQVQQAGHCARPIRLIGSSETINTTTGEVLHCYTTASEPDGLTYTRCKNRRRAVCPSCSHEYQGDVFHLFIAGAAGGMKGVPDTIVTHPLVFATLTAPSFGPVHAAKKPGQSGTRRCRPRTGDRRALCPHGRPSWCMQIHDHDDHDVGQPLCSQCYDYTGHLIWQWWAPELWRRFTITLRRLLARHLGLSETATRDLVRVQFAKVAEFQRRGVIHFHALIRLDGPPTKNDPYPAPLASVTAEILTQLVTDAAAQIAFDAPPVDHDDQPRALRFGGQIDVRPVHDGVDPEVTSGRELHPGTVAAYIAKYATKAAADLVDESRNVHLLRLKQLVQSVSVRALAANLAESDGPYRGLGRWADMLGFRGHFASKSRRYSTTLGQLRQARRDHTRNRLNRLHQGSSAESVRVGDDADLAELYDDSTLVVGSWRFAGIGWLTAGDAALAAASAARARDD